MGQKQSEYNEYSEYSENSEYRYDTPKKKEEEAEQVKAQAAMEETQRGEAEAPRLSAEDVEEKYQEIKKELNNLQLPFEKFKENYDFYKTNYEKLKKVNEIINNIKKANLYEETTFNILRQIVPEEDLKILPPNYSYQHISRQKEMVAQAPLKPKYEKLNKWEDLFNLEISDNIIDKLKSYVQSKVEDVEIQPKVEEVAKIYSEWKGNQSECDMINKYNFIEYEEEYKTEMSKIIFEKLIFMNLSEEDVENNLLFYWRNIEKLIKINDIINNIKFADFSDLSPSEVLAKIVPENELKKLNSEEASNNNDEKKEESNDENDQICSEYILPENWDDLFKLQISDKAIEKLYTESKIMKIARYYYLYKNEKNEPIETWLETINENNYEKYEEQFKEEFGKILEEDNKIKEILTSLTHLKKTEEEIRNNLEFYSNNIDQLKKINEIIDKIIRLNLYNMTPDEVYKKLTGDKGRPFYYSHCWEDLFTLQTDKWYINILYASVKNYIINKQSEKDRKQEQKQNQKKYEKIAQLPNEEEKNKLINNLQKLKHFPFSIINLKEKSEYYINNYSKIIDVEEAIEIAKKYKFYDIYNPRKVYKWSFKETDNTLPEKWETLFQLKWDCDKILKACEIERVKRIYSHFDNNHDYRYYNKLINVDNYDEYDRNFNTFTQEYKLNEKKQMIEPKIDEINKIVKYIEKNNFITNEIYSSYSNNWVNNLKEYEEKIKYPVEEIDIKDLKKYEELFKGYKEQIIQEKQRKKREEREERERQREEEEEEKQNYNNYSSKSNYSCSSSSNTDFKKSYVILCNYCKNKCVYCKKELKGTDIGKGSAFGLHRKCQTNSCYICGKSRDTKERQVSYLCKSCYGSRKADNTKCLDCQKSFK